ncbi:ankyrin repeat domain-containing protein 46 [Oreochromis niloticus]|uniref:ankyrin repeat domain-containing protein 46 n=1 Tax=Oreochromis niloticus TaxID=8128 RepID=UPI000393F00B|nr:ankyrin repeat domain-containing protein 46 [Oreochromis niloticus]XP_019210285.1 ankyrin repeat domain-containing protein 46 [Oreochromis niloticus]
MSARIHLQGGQEGLDSGSAMQSCSLLNLILQSTEGVLSSFRTTWQEFVEDDDFWRVVLLMVVIALLFLGIAYYVSRVLPFSGWRGGRKMNEDLYVEQKLWYLFVVQI